MHHPLDEGRPVDESVFHRGDETDPEDEDDPAEEYPKIPSKTPIARLLRGAFRHARAVVA